MWLEQRNDCLFKLVLSLKFVFYLKICYNKIILVESNVVRLMLFKVELNSING